MLGRARLGMSSAPTIALVDMANVCPRARAEAEYRDGIELVGELIRRAVQPRRAMGQVHEVSCRLYGGWFAHDGTPTEQRTWLLRNLGLLRGLRDGIRIIPEPADALACAPTATLWGTYRNGGQKMVDQMLAHDAVFYAQAGEHETLLLLSDDEDFMPAVLVIATATSAKVCWMRQRSSSGNDGHFDPARVELLTDSAWV